jgi:hypothetical protein
MKTRIAFVAFLMVAISAVAQEYDDMYFTSKDRAKVNASRSSQSTNNSKSEDDAELAQSKINPTDSYSGRGVNPEYNSQATSNSKQEDPQYFISGYNPAPANVNRNLNPYNNYNNQGSFYSPYYGNNFYGNNAYNNPYYGGYGMSGFGSPYSSFYPSYYGNGFNSGWSSMLGYMWGGMGSGFYGGMGYGNMGYGSMWGSPSSMFWNNYYGMNNYYGGYNGFGNYYGGGYYGYNSYYPRTVVIVDNGTSSYRKRADRSSTINNVANNNSRSTNGTSYTRNGRTISSTANGGRTQGTSDSSPYYDRSWKRNSDVTNNPGRNSSWIGGNSGNSRSGNGWTNGGRTNSIWGTQQQPSHNSWSNDNNSRNSFQFSGGNSSHSFGGSSGGGSRSSGGGGGGHSRGGRDN